MCWGLGVLSNIVQRVLLGLYLHSAEGTSVLLSSLCFCFCEQMLALQNDGVCVCVCSPEQNELTGLLGTFLMVVDT